MKISDITLQKSHIMQKLRMKTELLNKYLDVQNMDEQKIQKEKRENHLNFENTKLANENA